MTELGCPYVSRGGLKLAAAIEAFGLPISGAVCADLGCNVGGFSDCLLQHGAARVFAVDTAYGVLDWKLRQDARVTVVERANALHLNPADVPGWPESGGCDLVVIDLGWTRQRHAIPAARRWLRPPRHDAASPAIISLIKPHYENDTPPVRGWRPAVLAAEQAERIARGVLDAMPTLGVRVRAWIRSPILGGGSRGGKGNAEYLALLEPEASPPASTIT